MSFSNRYEPDDWTTDGSRIDTAEKVAAIKAELESQGPIIVKHWHYRGGCAPTHLVFDDFDDYSEYLSHHAQPGDAFDVWGLYPLLRGIGTLAEGKFPDSDGTVPKTGAY